MSTMYPLAVVSAASITHLARTTLRHYSISVYHAPIKTSEGTVRLPKTEKAKAAEIKVKG